MPDLSLRTICYAVAITVGVFVSLVELLGRYRSGNHPSWVLCGYPQLAYYILNGFSGAAAVFVAEASSRFDIASIPSADSNLAVIQSIGLGASAMFVLRSSLFSVAGAEGDSKIDIGPAHILNVLNKYLDKQIDKNRGSFAWKEAADIMNGLHADDIYPDILACLLISESVSKAKTSALKDDLEAIMANSDWKKSEMKAIAMGLSIQKEMGSEALRNVVLVLRLNLNLPGVDKVRRNEIEENSLQPTAKDVELIDGELDSELRKLWK